VVWLERQAPVGADQTARVYPPHRIAFDVPVKIDSTLIADRVAGEPAAEGCSAATVAGYRCSVAGIAVAVAVARTDADIATAPMISESG
jgi:hypothetical protein